MNADHREKLYSQLTALLPPLPTQPSFHPPPLSYLMPPRRRGGHDTEPVVAVAASYPPSSPTPCSSSSPPCPRRLERFLPSPSVARWVRTAGWRVQGATAVWRQQRRTEVVRSPRLHPHIDWWSGTAAAPMTSPPFQRSKSRDPSDLRKGSTGGDGSTWIH